MQQDYSIPASPPPTNDTGTVINGRRSNKDGLKSILSTLAILIAAPLTAVLLTTFVFQSYEVDGPSMETTLQHKDRLIVWKLHRTFSKVTGTPFIPKRGEVIIFVKKGLFTEKGTEKQLIKRVVGLPGDRVVVRDGNIKIYNKQNPDGFFPDVGHEYSNNIDSFTDKSVDIVVPPNQLFVAGDNRDLSLDSRTFGTIPVEDVVGELTFRILPVSKFTSYI